VRLFVAVQPPDDVLDRLAGLRRPERSGVRWTSRAQWHVTLAFLGEVADPGPVVAALDAAPLAPATADLGPAVAPLGRRVVCVPVAGLDDVAAVVRRALPAGDPDRLGFRGHLTLARVSRGRLGDLVGEPVAARFPVGDVRLVRSHLGGRGGPRYEDLHIRPLTGESAEGP
jgi:RNA 2',3'-cyclic 3'-phosphodiesterase